MRWPSRLVGSLLLVALCGPQAGCYDSTGMIAEAREKAALKQLEEVDLQEFRLTLPRQEGSTTILVVSVHPFVNVSKKHIDEVTAQLEQLNPQLRHELLLSVRAASPQELIEPELKTLRDRVRDVALSVLDAAPIHSLGFRNFEVYEQ